MSELICKDEGRRENVRRHQQLNGLDYLEFNQESDLQLTVHFLGKAPVKLDKTQVRIDGGRRIPDIKVIEINIITQESKEFDDLMQVKIDKIGDFSNYTLRVVEKIAGAWQTHSSFDPRYDRIEFNFTRDCPSELDCKQETICPPEQLQEPDINYLAKDYASFRQLILDRLALVMPEWQEKHVPDIGVALVEVLAYAGDHLSYYQDAVATEAYLETARQRISVRRHARLVDYAMHEGCNARAWVCVQVSVDIDAFKPAQIYFSSAVNNAAARKTVLTLDEVQQSKHQYEIFQPLLEDDIKLYQDHNRIEFYTWGNQLCCLTRGSTEATLLGQWVAGDEAKKPPHCETEATGETEFYVVNDSATDEAVLSTVQLNLQPGDVLIFEEVIGPETGHLQDANPKHRHAVRLTAVSAAIDPLNGQPVTQISWDDADALPFPLCLSVLGPAPECKMLENISVACGNVVLVDQGRPVSEDLDEVPQGEPVLCCKAEGRVADSLAVAERYNPVLKYAPLIYAEPVQNDSAAVEMLQQNVRLAVPEIKLINQQEVKGKQAWRSQLDLLASDADDQHFVAELDDTGLAHLRFGDGEMGRRPTATTRYTAEYRIGKGIAGNIAAGAIRHVIFPDTKITGVVQVRNPMPAQGGTAPEPMDQVKLYAPGAVQKELQRAIIADDYTAIVLREFKDRVQNAAAKLRWTGSGYEILLAIDALGQEQAEQSLLDEISARLHRYRRMGHDLQLISARQVALDIKLQVCVLPDYLRGHVKAELLQVFSNQRLTNGTLGFFHPDNLTFGDDVYLSRLIAAAQAIEGVASVTLIKMQRWCELANNEIESGVLPLGPFEIARLDNDPGFQENGILHLDMRGGR